MKLSLSWIFKHLNADWKKLNLKDFASILNSKICEIDSFKKIEINPAHFAAVKIVTINEQFIKVEDLNSKKTSQLPNRPGAQPKEIFLIKKLNGSHEWAKTLDFGSEKDYLLPALDPQSINLNAIEKEDYIISIDNKSINHRPDLWSVRGFAKEIAAIFDFKLINEDEILANFPVRHYENDFPGNGKFNLPIEVHNKEICKRFAAIKIEKIAQGASHLNMAIQLAKVDYRPLNFLVDLTNFVMFDIGQPLHAFDANKITEKIVCRLAKQDEKLKLIDESIINLAKSDYVIADSAKPLSLAGIMGGFESSITPATESVLIESANFDATSIRLSAAAHKKRTESSSRFEKSLDPNQNTAGILRLLKILDTHGIQYTTADSIVSIGNLNPEKTIALDHEFLIKKIGINIHSETVSDILSKLGFGVQIKNGPKISYEVAIPTARSTKDILIPDDLIEEVARIYGYEKITPILPKRASSVFDFEMQEKINLIKNYCAFSAQMNEVYNYAFYDEEFLKKIGFAPDECLQLKNPVSENQARLANSLIPNILKNLYVNHDSHIIFEHAFFEINKIWKVKNSSGFQEILSFSGIFANHTKTIDFYQIKSKLISLFKSLGLEIKFTNLKDENNLFDKNLTAQIFYNQESIGFLGKLQTKFINNLKFKDIHAFEIDLKILNNVESTKKFTPISKYQEVSFDVSMLLPINLKFETVLENMKSIDNRIKDIILLDFFQKKEWLDQKSMTLRFVILDDAKTLDKLEIDKLNTKVIEKLKFLGATIR